MCEIMTMMCSSPQLPVSAFCRGLEPVSDYMVSIVVRDMGNGVDRIESVAYVLRPSTISYAADPLDPTDPRIFDLVVCGLAAVGLSVERDLPGDAVMAGAVIRSGRMLYIMAWGCYDEAMGDTSRPVFEAVH